MTRRVAYQALAYAGFFILVYVFPTTSRIYSTVRGPPPYPIRFLAVSFVASQGFWNWVAYYLLPKCLDRMEKVRSFPTRRHSSARVSGESHNTSSSSSSSLGNKGIHLQKNDIQSRLDCNRDVSDRAPNVAEDEEVPTSLPDGQSSQ